jgi:Tfp pilus assembly protein PilN
MIRVNLLEARKAPTQAAATPAERMKFGKLALNASSANLIAMAAMFAAVGFIGFKWWSLNSQISELQAANARADQEKKQLEEALKTIDQYQAKKQVLEQRVNVISDLKRRQSVPVHLLDQISKQLPEFLWLDGMDEKQNQLAIKGRATTYNAVSNFYNNLKDSPFFGDVTMGITQRAPEGVSFQLQCKFIPPTEQKPAAPANADATEAPAAEPTKG